MSAGNKKEAIETLLQHGQDLTDWNNQKYKQTGVLPYGMQKIK